MSNTDGSQGSADADRVVMAYLRERGYKNAEAALNADTKGAVSNGSQIHSQNIEASIPDFLLFYSETEANNPNAYQHSYARLCRWVKDSLEKYRGELSAVLFPLFAHAYLDLVARSMQDQARQLLETHKKETTNPNTAETMRLASIATPDQIQSNELAQRFLTNRYTVRMSRYAFELLLAFLQDNKFMLLTRLLNRHVAIRVDAETPSTSAATSSEIQEKTGLSSLTPTTLDALNTQPVQLAPLPQDPWMVQELDFYLRDDKIDAEPFRDELKKLIKRESASSASAAAESMEGLTNGEEVSTVLKGDTPSRETVPQPPPKFTDVKKEVQALRDVREQLLRSSKGGMADPSISCFTFHNTYDTLTCLTTSPDHSLVCGGFSESYLKVWSLKGDKLRGFKLNANKVEGSDSKRLVGHAGPVYAARISSDKKFAISCSEDATVRLWSLDSYSNLAVYKGHNFPIWDVDLASNDVYFATSSFDGTSRLWRTDMINPLRIFVGHESDVDCVKFHPNCNYVATGGSDGEVRLWNIQKGNTVRVMRSHTGPVMALAFSEDGKTLASAGEDKTVKLWDLNSGRLIKSLIGHGDTVYSVAFNGAGTQLVSGGADQSVIVWNPNADANEPGMVLKPGGAAFGRPGREKNASPEMVGKFYTKRTPIFNVEYTRSNVVLAYGPFLGAAAAAV
ncbi:WD40-repeat-containing domain protein [Chytriomyces cf. hyalinus JEL632]|nr:WD40-repeat-containing domain protein [Chytriomyces cf. hyalinus JEL632]